MQRSEGHIHRATRNSLVPLAALLLASPAFAAKYAATGIVVSVDKQSGTAVISHREIPGYMPAMVMPLRVERAADLDALKPGKRIRFDLVVEHGKSRIRNIRPEETDAAFDFPVPAPKNRLALGATVPDFELTDQNNRRVRLMSLRGKPVAIQFIYTRCPLPDVCPRLASHFAYVHRRLRDRVTLMSITLDPDHDTPAELAVYAKRWNASGPSWRFLTGSGKQVEEVADWFGVIFWPEEGAITHTAATAILSAEGRLEAVLDGSLYRAEQLLHVIENSLR